MVSRARPQKATAMKPHCSSCPFADWITMLTVPALKTSEVIVNGLPPAGVMAGMTAWEPSPEIVSW